MFLTLTPDDNLKTTVSQREQVDFTSSIPSGLLLQPNTKIALYSASWNVLEGITIPTGSFSITVMGQTFKVDITGQTFLEQPAGSSETAGSLCANYLNDQINDAFKNNGSPTLYSGLNNDKRLKPAYQRFGDLGDASTSSNLWTWDSTGKDFTFELKYNTENDHDTGSTVMVSGANASKNFNDGAYTQVVANDLDLGGGSYRYRLRPANSKNTDVWNDSGFCAFGTAFCCDGTAEGGKGKHGEMVFKWSDGGGSAKAMVGFSTKDFDPTKSQVQASIMASIELETGSAPVFRENGSALTLASTPANISNGDFFRMRMESSETGDEVFTYALSTDGGSTYTDFVFNNPATDRYASNSMDSEEIMPFFKPYTQYTGTYGVDNMECSLVPSKDSELGSGYKWDWSNYPETVGFDAGDLATIFDIQGFNEDNGAGKSDGGVVNNVNTTTSGVYVDIPTLGIKSITSGVERNVIGCLPIGEMSDGTNGMGSIHGLQYNQVYNVIYHDVNNQQEREHNQMRVRLIDEKGTLLTNISSPAITLCVKPAST
tara:strand:- start:1697 stop:3325 length:1629 start_codon:yes stop_codon:yes gene_type:complete